LDMKIPHFPSQVFVATDILRSSIKRSLAMAATVVMAREKLRY
jgi:hypothetical protein